MQEIDYGGWLTEDLKELYSELIKQRDRLEACRAKIKESEKSKGV